MILSGSICKIPVSDWYMKIHSWSTRTGAKIKKQKKKNKTKQNTLETSP